MHSDQQRVLARLKTMATVAQLHANRANATKSTGPRTLAGKARSSGNALRHGVRATRMFVDQEEAAGFAAMLSELCETLGALGALEEALVERIAMCIWRQRRLAVAEGATLRLQRRPQPIARRVSSEVGRSPLKPIQPSELQAYDEDLQSWCAALVSEAEALDEISLEALPRTALRIFRQLQDDAAEHETTCEGLVADYDGGLTQYVRELVLWCHEQLQEAEGRPEVLEVAEDLRDCAMIPSANRLDLFARYGTTLDNQLSKALRDLREAQAWRLQTLETVGQRDEVAD